MLQTQFSLLTITTTCMLPISDYYSLLELLDLDNHVTVVYDNRCKPKMPFLSISERIFSGPPN